MYTDRSKSGDEFGLVVDPYPFETRGFFPNAILTFTASLLAILFLTLPSVPDQVYRRTIEVILTLIASRPLFACNSMTCTCRAVGYDVQGSASDCITKYHHCFALLLKRGQTPRLSGNWMEGRVKGSSRHLATSPHHRRIATVASHLNDLDGPLTPAGRAHLANFLKCYFLIVRRNCG